MHLNLTPTYKADDNADRWDPRELYTDSETPHRINLFHPGRACSDVRREGSTILKSIKTWWPQILKHFAFITSVNHPNPFSTCWRLRAFVVNYHLPLTVRNINHEISVPHLQINDICFVCLFLFWYHLFGFQRVQLINIQYCLCQWLNLHNINSYLCIYPYR